MTQASLKQKQVDELSTSLSREKSEKEAITKAKIASEAELEKKIKDSIANALSKQKEMKEAHDKKAKEAEDL